MRLAVLEIRVDAGCDVPEGFAREVGDAIAALAPTLGFELLSDAERQAKTQATNDELLMTSGLAHRTLGLDWMLLGHVLPYRSELPMVSVVLHLLSATSTARMREGFVSTTNLLSPLQPLLLAPLSALAQRAGTAHS